MQLQNLIRKDKWPLYVATGVLILLALFLLSHVLNATGGVFFLPDDQAYIQLSTAKTLAFRQIWGIGRHDFAAASPSLLYPIVLAVSFCIFGAHLAVVPALNGAIAIVLLACIQQWLAKRHISPLNQVIILVAVIVLSPLPSMILFGAESPLLLLFAFLFVSNLADEWSFPEFSRRTLIYGALLVASRYDGALLIAIVSLLLLWRRRWLAAFELALWSLLPILAFGFLSLFKGSSFLPNYFILRPADILLSYDWLVGCGCAIIAPLLQTRLTPHPPNKIRLITAIPGSTFVLLLLTTNLYAIREYDRSSSDTYKAKYPVVQFLHRYYYTTDVASDNIGMISFFTEGRYLDLSGLATNQMARSKVDHVSSPQLIERSSKQHNSRIVIISSHYADNLPGSWIKTASWNIPGIETWSFYAVDTFADTYLREKIRDFMPLLPSNIDVKYYDRPSGKMTP